MSKALVLFSGGLDSTTVLAIAQKVFDEVIALTIVYGQRHDVELNAAKILASKMKVTEHIIFEIPLQQMGGSALTDDIEVPKDREDSGEIPITYVPARNTIFLSIALGLCEVRGASDLFIGVNAVDYSGYPDCRPEYIAAYEKMANLATKAGVTGEKLTIHTPLLNLTKKEIISQGLELGVDYSLTHSCYDPIDGNPCKHCDACLIRLRAFAELGMVDPVVGKI